jgi:hypothetical protein
MTATKAILDSIETRLRDIRREIDTLTTARAALDGQASRTRKPRGDRATTPGLAVAHETSRGAPATIRVRQDRTTSTSAADQATRRSRGTTRRKSRAKARRTGDVASAETLELLLSETSGLTTSELAGRTNTSRNRVLTVLRQLEATGRVRRTGQRRATRWHPISDEQWIQQRAAELAARSRRVG